MGTRILLASEIFQSTEIDTGPGYSPSASAPRHNRLVEEFAIVFDDRARRWLEEHHNRDALVIAYSDTRC
jgi:hypothetical protein